jgi:hypothetical protein
VSGKNTILDEEKVNHEDSVDSAFRPRVTNENSVHKGCSMGQNTVINKETITSKIAKESDGADNKLCTFCTASSLPKYTKTPDANLLKECTAIKANSV